MPYVDLPIKISAGYLTKPILVLIRTPDKGLFLCPHIYYHVAKQFSLPLG